MTIDVCILDDDSVHLMLARHALLAHGWTVTCFKDPKNIDWASVDKSAVFLLDLMMDGLDGLHLLGELEKRHYRGSVAIISGVDISSVPNFADSLLSLDLHIAGFLPKPFLATALMALVQRSLNRDGVSAFSAESRKMLPLALESGLFSARFNPTMDYGSGSIHSLLAEAWILLGSQWFYLRELDDLLLYASPPTHWLEILFRHLAGSASMPDSWRGKPIAIALPAGIFIQPLHFEMLLAALAQHVQGPVFRLMVSEEDYLLWGDRLADPLRRLNGYGHALVLDRAKLCLREEFLSDLMIFDELRLLPQLVEIANPARTPHDLSILKILHNKGYALTLRTSQAWMTQRPDSEFRPELFAENRASTSHVW